MRWIDKMKWIVPGACLAASMLGASAFAAEGTLMFSDPETQVAETVSVDIVIQSAGEALGDVTVELSYDTGYLEFLEADNVESDGDGILIWTCSGSGTETEYRETLEFTALQTGETVITVEDTEASLYSGEELTLAEGTSTITIEAADDGTTSIEPAAGKTDIVITVNGEDYYFSEGFTASDIPLGYEETSLTFHGEERAFVVNDADVYLGYLVNEDDEGEFFLYNEDDATFVPYTVISISDSTSIVLLSDTSELVIPSDYKEGVMTVGDLTYPYWIAPDDEDCDILYALNITTGNEGFYRYDPEDDTYQAYEMAAEEEAAEEEADTFLSNLGALAASFPLLVLIILAVLAALMILFLVKLIFRNQELDYLYDHCGITFGGKGDSCFEEAAEQEKISADDDRQENGKEPDGTELTEEKLLNYFKSLEIEENSEDE